MTTHSHILGMAGTVRLLVRTVARVAAENACAGEDVIEGLAQAYGDTPQLRREIVEAVLTHDAPHPPWGLLADAQRWRQRQADVREADIARIGDCLGIDDAGEIAMALDSMHAPEAVFCALFIASAGYAAAEIPGILERLGLGPAHAPEGYRMGYPTPGEGPFRLTFLPGRIALPALAA